MGKRKRRSDNKKTPPPSDLTQHEPQVDLPSQISSKPAESSATQHPPSFMEALNSSIKKSPSDQNRDPSSHLLSSRPFRNTLGRHYSRRNSNIASDASPSNSKGPPPYDHKLSFKLNRQNISGSPYCDNQAQIVPKPESIRPSLFAQNGDLRKMECKICNKSLRKYLPIVAVLVCGHAYHADCLDQKTEQQEKLDPTCPLCESRTS